MALNYIKAFLKRKTKNGIDVLAPVTTADNVMYDESKSIKKVIDDMSVAGGSTFQDIVTGDTYKLYLENGVVVFDNEKED